MSREDLFCIVLSEVTGQPESLLRESIQALYHQEGGEEARARLQQELSPQEAQALLTRLRAEPANVLTMVYWGILHPLVDIEDSDESTT